MTLSQITNLLFGHRCVLFFNAFIGFALFGINVLFILFFTQTALSLFVEEDVFWYKMMIISALFISMAPVVMKRQISELSFQAYLLTSGIICVLVIMTIKSLKSPV
jgi:hypothetical protein